MNVLSLMPHTSCGRRLQESVLLSNWKGRNGPADVGDLDLDDLVAAEVRSATARFPEMELSTAIEPVRLRRDADALRRLVSNLVENACLYGEADVQVVVTSLDGNPRLEVHDGGPGVRPRRQSESLNGLSAWVSRGRARQAPIEVADPFLGGACFRVEFQAAGC